ncbi:MAG: hypothetical protein JO112_11200 [Planctomycetes bacterium]|nr:hypothetical protein [Planctomycetota bacterium]
MIGLVASAGRLWAELTEPTTLTGLIIGLIGAVSETLGIYLARRYKVRSNSALTEQQRLFAQYRRLVDELQEQVGQLRGEVIKIQNQYLECRVEGATLKARIAELEMEIARIEGRSADGPRESSRPADRGQSDGGSGS